LDEMVERTCIVTRQAGEPGEMIRFVAGPDLTVVPDLKRNLPGRGCWVTAERARVDEAVRKKLFRRGLKAEVTVNAELGALVDALMVKALSGGLGLARKAGAVALGSAKVDAAIRSGKALFVLHAFEAAEDGVRKMTQARKATVHLGGPDIPAYKLLSETEMGLAMGGANVIHAAVLAQDAGKAAFRRAVALDRYRGGPPDGRAAVEGVPVTTTPHKDTE